MIQLQIPSAFISPSSRARAAVLLSTLAGVAVLLRFPPDDYSFYPRCPIFVYLHLQCPGCGATRALYALLHGHLLQALHYNLLATLLAPLAFFYLVLNSPRWLECPISLPQPKTRVVYATIAVTMVFAIVRNLPL